jgi:hypothetical protein
LQKVKRRNLGKAAVLTSLARGFQRSHRWTTTFYRGKTFSAASFGFGEVAGGGHLPGEGGALHG